MFEQRISQIERSLAQIREQRQQEQREYEELNAMPLDTDEQVAAFKAARDRHFKKYPI